MGKVKMKTEKECFYVIRETNDRPIRCVRPQIYLLSTETDRKEDEQVINLGYTPVVLSKLFGPLIFADLLDQTPLLVSG